MLTTSGTEAFSFRCSARWENLRDLPGGGQYIKCAHFTLLLPTNLVSNWTLSICLFYGLGLLDLTALLLCFQDIQFMVLRIYRIQVQI